MDWPSEPPVPSIGRCRRGPDLPPASGSADRIVSYLTRDCRIPLELVQALIRDKILYQSDAGDAVFTAPDGKYAEVLNCADTRNAIVHGSKPDKFWWFKACGMDAKPVAVYMCGSALDAVSLYAIHQIEHPRLLELQKAAKDPALNLKISRREAALYVSLGTREAAAAVLEGMFMSHSMYAAFGGSPEGRALARFCCEQEAYRKANELIPAHGSWHEALIAGASAWLAGDFNSIPLPRED